MATFKFVNFTNSERPALPNQPTHPYQYKALGAPDEIRLVEILPGMDSETLRCRILHRRLKDVVFGYTALSYTWGSTKWIHQVSCEPPSSGFLTITGNCFSAMLRLRHRVHATTIWIDAICINQTDIPERNSQVGMMGDIYSKADETIVYLGDNGNESEIAMQYVRSFSNSAAPRDPSDKEKRALSLLLDRAWFNRMWVLQEVYLSRFVTVVCGDDSASWNALWGAADYIRTHRSKFDWPYLPPVLTLRKEKSNFRLWELLSATRPCASTDPRDKLFALAAIVSDAERPIIRPDYNMSAEEVYTNLVTHFLDTTGLDFLLAVQYTQFGLDLPSWVPDWSVRFITEQFTNTSMLFDRAGGARPRAQASIICLGSLQDTKVLDSERPVLRVRGVRLADIKRVTKPRHLCGPGSREMLDNLVTLNPRTKRGGQGITSSPAEPTSEPRRNREHRRKSPVKQKGMSIFTFIIRIEHFG